MLDKKDFQKAGYSSKDAALLEGLAAGMPEPRAVPVFDCWMSCGRRAWLEGGYDDPRNAGDYKWTADSKIPICHVCKEEHGTPTITEAGEILGVDLTIGL